MLNWLLLQYGSNALTGFPFNLPSSQQRLLLTVSSMRQCLLNFPWNHFSLGRPPSSLKLISPPPFALILLIQRPILILFIRPCHKVRINSYFRPSLHFHEANIDCVRRAEPHMSLIVSACCLRWWVMTTKGYSPQLVLFHFSCKLVSVFGPISSKELEK